MGREPGMDATGLHRVVTQALRIVEPAEQQTRATERVVGPAWDADHSSGREELFGFLEPAQRLTGFAELRQYPGRGGDCIGKVEEDVSGPDPRGPVLDEWARLRPLALEDVQCARSAVGLTD